MRMIIQASMKQAIFLLVNVGSFKRCHVKKGKTRYDVPNPTNLAPHAESLHNEYAYLDA